jgi:hypothetical protein
MREFVDEDDLNTLDGWLKYQGVDTALLSAEEVETWKGLFVAGRERTAADPKVGAMKLRSIPDDYRYAVAIEDGSELWLTLWVRRSPKGEFFVMQPRGESGGDPHTSYHLDGNLHMKGHGHKHLTVRRQTLTGAFRGVVSLGQYHGHSPRGVGAICDPCAFAGVVRIPVGVLGPRDGGVLIDLVEPGMGASFTPWKNIVAQKTFADFKPNVVITVGCNHKIA